MTVTEFEVYLQKGLGRAILLLREEPDKTPFREVVLTHLIGGRNRYYYNERSLAYVLDLLACFDDRDALLQEVADGICRKIEEGDFFGNNELLLAFGMEQAYKESYQQRYRSFKEKIRSHMREKNTSEEAMNDRQRFLNAHIPLIRSAEKEEIRAILTDLIDLYALTEETEYPYRFPDAIQIRLRLEKRFGNEEAAAILQETADAHPSGALLIKNVHYRRAEPPRPDPAVTAEEILNGLSPCEIPEEHFIEASYQHKISFTVASPEVVRQVAEALLVESDLTRRTALLKLFHPYAYLYQNTLHSEPRFPLGEEALLPLLDDVDWQSQISKNGFVTEYIDALLTVIIPFRHPKLKSLGEDLRQKGYPLARYGIDILISQYTAADRETLISCLREAPVWEGFDELSRILHHMHVAAHNGTPDLPLDVIPSLWERIPTDNLRKDAVEVLLQYEMLPDDLREECRYDRNPAVRELIKENHE